MPAPRFVIAACAAIVVVLAHVRPLTTAQNFADEFNAPFGRGWTWDDPSGSAAYSVFAGGLKLSVPGHGGQPPSISTGPKLLRDQPFPPWTIETRLLSVPGDPAAFAGLTVYYDSRNWLVWGASGTSLEASGVINGRRLSAVAVLGGHFQYLRIRRVLNSYHFDASNDGTTWTNANVYTDNANALEGARFGLLARTAAADYEARFDYFREDRMSRTSSPLTPPRILSTARIAQKTGPASVTGTDAVDVCGTDYGVMFRWQEKTWMVFGDTKGCEPGSVMWKSNSMAFTSDTDPSDGLTIDGWVLGADGKAKELFPEDPGAITAIATGAVAVGDTAYLYYMQVMSWDRPPGNWTCNLSSIASAHAADPGSWSKHQSAISWAPGNFNQLAVLREGSTLYVWGTPCGRFGSVKLMKVEAEDILSKDAYRYFAGFDARGLPFWSEDDEDAVAVAGGPAGEISVRFNAYLGRYVMTYLDQRRPGIVMREAPRPWGPWSPPVVLVRSFDYPQLYGAFMPEGLEDEGGKAIYFMMSQFGPYNTFWMKTVLE